MANGNARDYEAELTEYMSRCRPGTTREEAMRDLGMVVPPMPADLVWTREAPTEPGHFWIRYVYLHGPGDPFMCEAVPFGFGGGVHHLAFIGLEDEFDVPSGPLNEWDMPALGSAIAAEWSGPIPLPKEAM